MLSDIVGTRAVEYVADVFCPLLQHAEKQESDDENEIVPIPDPVQQSQQRIGGVKQSNIQLTETQLDKLLRLNDMFNDGILGNSVHSDMQLLRNFKDKDIANTYQQAVNPVQGANIYQPDLSSFVSGTDSPSLPHGGLDYSDFGRNATEGLLTDHTDYALLDSSHSPDWDMYSTLSKNETKTPRSDKK